MNIPTRKNGFHKRSLRSQLLLHFILVAVLPTMAVSVGSILFGYYNARQNAVKRLDSLIALEEIKVDTWMESCQNELAHALNETYLLERIQVSLKIQDKSTYYDYYKEGALYRLNRYLAETRLMEAISVVDLNGEVILTTDVRQEGENFGAQPFFEKGLKGFTLRIVTDDNLEAGYRIAAANPVSNMEGVVIGELVGFIKPETLAALLDAEGLPDSDGRVLLANEENHQFSAEGAALRLVQSGEGQALTIHSAGIDQALEEKASGFMSYRDEQGGPVYGVYRWIPGLNMALMVEQWRAAVLTDIFTNQVVNLAIILAGILLAVIISILTARRIATPLASLAQASEEIASGNFSRTVDVEQEDEIGVLARAFNSMAAQLRGLIGELEARVRDRTGELQESNQQLLKRALQMETTSQVSREITSILDMDALLRRVVNLIRESFAYYHVSIYLLERGANRLVWRAGSSKDAPQNTTLDLTPLSIFAENGDRAAGRRPGLREGQKSMNGKAAQTNQPIWVDDLRSETAFEPNPSLPESRSELVVPLRMGEQVIGTMDIHHRLPGAFSPEERKVLQGLGDQIAIAINNALLYEKIQSLAVLEERNRMARELHDSVSQLLYSQVLYADASSKFIHAGQSGKAIDYVNQLQESAHQALKEMRLMIYELRPSVLENEGLWGAIQHRLEIVERRSEVDVQLDGDSSVRLAAPLEKELYLIAQEALNNVLKHSHARSVNVGLRQEGSDMIFVIADDGVGFDPDTVKSGLGLENIRHYAGRAGGTMSIDSQPGRGTRLEIRIPGGGHDA